MYKLVYRDWESYLHVFNMYETIPPPFGDCWSDMSRTLAYVI